MAVEELKPRRAFRLVLLGWASSGKSSSGNTILGTDEFISGRKTFKCVSCHTDLGEREVTVVDTPGWTDYSLHDTEDCIKEEIISSVIPAPDAVLLLIPLDIKVTDIYIQSAIDHLSLLGNSVWSYTMVLFTFGRCLGSQTIERYIEGNSGLQFLTKLCGNNYHVFENTKRTDSKQVEDLLNKIENMSTDNNETEDPEEVKHISEVAEKPADVDKETPEKPTSSGVHCFPEVRVIVVGLRKAGKSSTGNTILGSPKFREFTEKSQKEEKKVAGRKLVVIDTPPWLKSSDTSHKENIVNWVSQCPPGPHAFLFVLNLCSKFSSDDWKFVQRHMELLGDRVWEHVIVVFTGADILEGIDIKSYVRTKDTSLQKLLEMCGNRHYVFNNKTTARRTQVTDLLEGIEKLSSQHIPGFYEIDRTIAKGIEEMNQALLNRAEKKCQKLGAMDRIFFHKGKAQRLSEVRIVLLGEKRSGKTMVAKTMAKLFYKEERNKCVATETGIDERTVLIVDTPGWLLNTCRELGPNQEIIQEALSLCHPEPHALLIVVNLGNSFTEKHKAALKHNLACLSDAMWKNTMVLFTFGERLQGETIEQYIKNEGDSLQWLVAKCSNRYHVFSDMQFKDLPQIRELLEKIDEMVEANSNPYLNSIHSQTHNHTLLPCEGSEPSDIWDEDFDFTPREIKMMEKMVKKLREVLLMELKCFVSALKPTDQSRDEPPKMGADTATATSEDWRSVMQKNSSGYESGSKLDTEDEMSQTSQN